MDNSNIEHGPKLWAEGLSLIQTDRIKAEHILLKSEQIYENNPINLHFTYNSLIELYRIRDTTDAKAKCLKYCKKDFKILSSLKSALLNEYPRAQNPLPRSMPSADILIRDYELRAEFKEAILLCDNIISFGIDYFLNDKKRIQLKMQLSAEFDSYEEFAIEKVKNTVKNSPGINKGKLLEKLQSDNILLMEEAHKYLEEAITRGIVKQEKKGRSLIHTVV